MSANELQKAVFEAVSADATVTGLAGGGKIFDRRSAGKDLPHVVFAGWRTDDWSSGSETGAEHVFDIEIWTEENGRKRATELADAVRAALHDQPLALDGARLVNLRHQRTQTRRETASRLHTARLTFRAAIET